MAPFCSWEYWQSVVQNSIGCTLGSLVAVLVALVIYRKQTHDAEKAQTEIELQEQDNILRYFYISLDEIVKMLTHQSENIAKYIETLKQDPLSDTLMTYVPVSSIKRLIDGSIPMEKLLNSYVNKYIHTKDAVKTFAQIYDVLDYVYLELTSLPVLIERSLTHDHNRKKKFSDYYKTAWDQVGNFITTLSEEDPANIALRNAMQKLSEQKTDNSDIRFHHDHFICPVNDIALGVLSIGRKEFMQLTIVTRDAKQLFSDMYVHQTHFIAGDLTPIHNKIIEETEKLQSLMASLTGTYAFVKL